MAMAQVGWDHMWGWGWGVMIVGMFFWVALVVLLVWLVVSATRRSQHPPSGVGRRALGILDERYARGEIDREEYLARRADLER